MAKKKDYKTLLTTPFETGIRNFSTIVKYYLYYAPNIDSAHSVGKIEDSDAEIVLKNMFETANIKGKTRILKSIKQQSWAKSGFDTDEIDFEDSRILCNQFNNESELTALLRHIRNSLAHGYIYVWRKPKKGNFIFFVDNDGKKEKKITAKILISMSILENWKALLERQLVKGE